MGRTIWSVVKTVGRRKLPTVFQQNNDGIKRGVFGNTGFQGFGSSAKGFWGVLLRVWEVHGSGAQGFKVQVCGGLDCF